jgi:hypothetical protein
MRLLSFPFLSVLAAAQTTPPKHDGSGAGGGSYPARYGPGYNIGPTTNEILRTETTYTPGPMQKNVSSLLFLWPGIINNEEWGKGDLIQTVAEASPGLKYMCKAKPGQW